MKHEDNPKSIKYYVKRFFQREKDRYAGKVVVDFPAGNGVTTQILNEIGANPLPLDLFPEYYELQEPTCAKANIAEGLPLTDGQADHLICQEGIEHFSDQLAALQEFNRVLKKGGGLIITTPNYSNMRAKMSYLLSESERFNSIIAPNELDSIWMNRQDINKEVYYGHIFLIGVLKLRCLAKLSGFKIKRIESTRKKSTSILLGILYYPWIRFSNWRTYRKRMRKNKNHDEALKKAVYSEIFRLSTSWKILTDAHIFIEFEKECELGEVREELHSQHIEFGTT